MNRYIEMLSLSMLVCLTGCASDESRLRARADAGEVEAQYQLASLYWEGTGVDRNHAEALKWYEQAAHRGHRFAGHDKV